jgi:1-deoxy-D-xylulose-5-phosphate synthase
MTLMAPADREDLEAMLELCQTLETPAALRYPRGLAASRPKGLPFSEPRVGKAELWAEGEDIVFLAAGSMAYPCLEAAQLLLQQKIYASVVNVRFVKPLDETLILDLYGRCRALITVEEGVLKGGFGSAVLELLESSGRLNADPKPVKCLGLPNAFITFDSRPALLEKYGLAPRPIAEAARGLLSR